MIDLHHLSDSFGHVFHELIEVVRPGGGQSYSGSSRSSGGGGGGYSGGGGGTYHVSTGGGSSSSGGGGAFFFVLFALIAEHPAIALPLIAIIMIVFFVRAATSKKATQTGWATQDYSNIAFEPIEEQEAVAATQGVPRRSLDRIRETDPDFSIILFEDFLYTLYAEMMRARGQQGAMSLGAYLSASVQQVLAAKSLQSVTGIVIGAMRVFSIDRTAETWRITLDFEANLTEATQRLYVVDRLTVERKLSAKSRPPARSRTLDCPNCGAPMSNLRGDQCTHCKQQVGMGRFDWSVVYFERLQKEARNDLLTSNVEEAGTDSPTVVDPMANQELANLRQRDPSFDWNAFQQRIGLAFNEMQTGWSNRDLSRVRPFVSDNLFQSQAYWIDLYTQAHARNITEGARITRIDFANVISDKFFDAITVRLYATSTDYTIGDDGRLLSGNKTAQRVYSEYWTMIRGSGKTGPTKTTPECPSCGAPLKLNQSGTCSYCNVKVTTGEFDWVLSRIEQDDSYTG